MDLIVYVHSSSFSPLPRYHQRGEVKRDNSIDGIKLYSVIASEDAYSALVQSRQIEKKRLLELNLFFKGRRRVSVFNKVYLFIDKVDTWRSLSSLFSEQKSRFYI